MLFPRPTLDAIARGKVDTAYRRWARPTVKPGGTLKTAVGVLDITSISETTPASITTREARRAGYPDRETLLKELDKRTGVLYRIRLCLAGPDPRLALREDTRIRTEDFRALADRLDRLDTSSRHGAWVVRVLRDIKQSPKTRTGEAAERLELPKEWLKTSVRKLKNLGLTISREPGYELSPRGREVLRRLEAESKRRAAQPDCIEKSKDRRASR